MKTLLLWSGGADSTFLLNKLLTETNDEVTAMTFVGASFSSTETSNEELKHLPDLELELQKIRPFNTVSVNFDPSAVNDPSITRHYYTFFVNYAAPFLNDGTYDRIASGRTWEQHNQTVIPTKNILGMPATFAAHRLFKKVATRGVLWEPLITHDFVFKYGRYHALKQLPSNLADKVCSCYTPRFDAIAKKYTACGSCYKCIWDQKVLQLVGQEYGPEAIDYYRRAKSLQYCGGRNLSVPLRYWLPLEMGLPPFYSDLDTKEKVQIYAQTKGHHSIGKTKFATDDIWNMETLRDDEAIMPTDLNPSL